MNVGSTPGSSAMKRILSALGDVSAVQAGTVEQVCTAAVTVFAGYRVDLPAGLVYLLSADGESARLVADYGVRPGSTLLAPALPGTGIGGSIQEVGRTGSPVVVTGLSDRFPGSVDVVASPLGGAEPDTAVILPLDAAGRPRPAGVLVLVVSPYRALDDEYRTFLDLVARQVGTTMADTRAYTAHLRRTEELAELDRIAEALQYSLLPQKLPELRRLMLAAHYQSGNAGTQAGCDWYDVIPLADTRVAIVVGDVGGQGTPTTAVTGQLRNALAGYLLEGHPPATALEHLDRFGCRVEGAPGSSVVCVVLDTVTGELRWARAGHPPPLVIDHDGARFLEDARGTVLAVPGGGPFEEGCTRLHPGASVLLYTDGLVEHRGVVTDDSLAQLATAATALGAATPAALLPALLQRTLHKQGPADDLAVIVAQLLPEPLHERLPADPTQLGRLRRTVAVWAAAEGISPDTVADLQLTIGEAVANAIEHAYRNGIPGDLDVDVRRQPGGAVDVRVRDFGSWRPPPEDRGYRGRGLTLIREIAAKMAVDIHADGTEIRFQLPPRPANERPEWTGPTRSSIPARGG